MEWSPLYIALIVWVVIVFITNKTANQRSLEARLMMDEANAISREYLKHIKENSRLLEELNALLREQK